MAGTPWVLIPCLAQLRAEFNQASPHRDKGADGSIGDSAHTSTSDHTPDEDSDALRNRDPDRINEVHALDIDSTGPWPDGGWFERAIDTIVERHRLGLDNRLSYVIHNRLIASAKNGWRWQGYTGKDPHTNHAHFSASYDSAKENDTRPWIMEEPVAFTQDDADRIADTILNRNVRGGATSYGSLNGCIATMMARTDLLANRIDLASVPPVVAELAGILGTIQQQLDEIRAMLAKLPGSA